MMDRQEYEEYYGERVIHCNIHDRYYGTRSIDSCSICEEEAKEEMEMSICVTCHYESTEVEDFVTVTIQKTNQVHTVCHSCYDGYLTEVAIVKEQNALKAEQLTYAINTDYLE